MQNVIQKDIVSIGMNSVQELTINLVGNPYNQINNPSTGQYIYRCVIGTLNGDEQAASSQTLI